MIYAVILWAAIMLFPKAFAGIFSSDSELVGFAAKALRIYLGGMFLMGAQIACQMAFVSIGNAPCSIIVAVVRKFVLLIPLIYIMPHIISDKAIGVYTAEPIADVLAVTFTLILFASKFRSAMKSLKSPKQPKNDIEKRHDENRVFLFNAFVLQSELCRLKYPSGCSETSFSGQQHSVIVKLFSRLLTVESQRS